MVISSSNSGLTPSSSFSLTCRQAARWAGFFIEFVDIHLHLVADLLADERLAVGLVHRDQTHVSVRNVHLAVVERHRQRLVRSHLLGVHQAAEAAQVVRTVVVVHLLVDLDLVVGQLILVGKLQLDLGSLADLEHEFELGGVVEIEVALLLRGNHVAQIVDALLLEIFENGVRSLTVGLLGQDALAVHLLDDAHGGPCPDGIRGCWPCACTRAGTFRPPARNPPRRQSRGSASYSRRVVLLQCSYNE